MPYRGPQVKRQQRQSTHVLHMAGVTATWRQFVSAAGGNEDVGLEDTLYWRTQTITASFGDADVARLPEHQTPAGVIAKGDLYCVSRVKLGREDELVWNGSTYRVESEPVRARINQGWVSLLKRGDE
jgi:hypothetical protein